MPDPRDNLLLVAQLRAALRTRSSDHALGRDRLDAVLAELDASERESLAQLRPATPEELAEKARTGGLAQSAQLLRDRLRGERLALIEELRRKATAEQRTEISLAGLLHGYGSVPTQEFDWPALNDAWRQLALVLRGDAAGRDLTVSVCLDFFRCGESVDAPARAEVPLSSLMGRLVDRRLVDREAARRCAEDVRTVEHELAARLVRDAAGSSEVAPASRGNIDYLALERLVGLDDPPADPGPALLRWRGPCFARLAARWWEHAAKRSREEREQAADLLMARTGIDPITQANSWIHYLDEAQRADQQGALAFRFKTRKDGILYPLAFMLSAESLIGELGTSNWWPVVERMRAAQASPVPTERLRPTLPQHAQPEAAAPTPPEAATPLAAAAAPPRTARDEPEEAPDSDAFVPEDDFEYAQAPSRVRSEEDRLVESRSAWNIYLRPFLSENWLGLVGSTSLMAAWMFLTMWLWDKGQAYRIGMGAVPLLCLTLGAAWVSDYISRLRDASPRAVGLFAALALLSIPFNFALGASLLLLDTLLARATSGALLVLYLLVSPRVGRWLRSGFGHAPTRALMEVNALAYLPPLVLWFAGPAPLRATLAGLVFASYAALVRSLFQARGQSADFRFCWTLLGAMWLLTAAIPHVYFREFPAVPTLSILAQLIAITVARLGDHRFFPLVCAAGVSLLGLVHSFSAPEWSPLALAVASLFWFDQRHRLEQWWPGEVLALHLLAVAVALAWQLGAGAAAPVLIVPALLAMIPLERRMTLRALSYSLPVLMAACAYFARVTDEPLMLAANLSLLLVAGAWAHVRYSNGFKTGLYFSSFALLVVLPAVALRLDQIMPWPGNLMALGLYAAGIAALWGIASQWLTDPLSRLHRSLLLWILAALAFAGCAASLVVISTVLLPALAAACTATLVPMAFAAWRTSSQVPVYAAMLLLGLVGLRLRLEFGISPNGLSGLLPAAALLLVSEWLRRTGALIRPARDCDTLFGRPFPGYAEQFVARPLELSALLLSLYGAAQAIVHSELLNITGDRSPGSWLITLPLAYALITRSAWRELSRELGLAALAPLGALLVLLTLQLPLELRGHAVLLLIAAGHYATARLTGQSAAISAALEWPTRQIAVGATWAALPFQYGFYGVLIMTGAPIYVVAGWIVIAIAFTHRHIVCDRPERRAHLVHAHLLLGSAFAYLHAWQLFDGQDGTLILLPLAAMTILALPALYWERDGRAVFQAYARCAWPWLTALALLYVAGVGLGTLADFADFHVAVDQLPAPLYPALMWLALEFVERRWRIAAFEVLKALSCIWFTFAVYFGREDPSAAIGALEALGAVYFATLLYLSLELGLEALAAKVGERLRTTPEQPYEPARHRRRCARVMVAMATAVVLVHFSLIADHGGSSVGHAWLYGLVPMGLWAYRALNSQTVLYLSIAIVAYATALYAVRLENAAAAHGLGVLHLLSGAFIVSMALYLSAARWVQWRLK